MSHFFFFSLSLYLSFLLKIPLSFFSLVNFDLSSSKLRTADVFPFPSFFPFLLSFTPFSWRLPDLLTISRRLYIPYNIPVCVSFIFLLIFLPFLPFISILSFIIVILVLGLLSLSLSLLLCVLFVFFYFLLSCATSFLRSWINLSHPWFVFASREDVLSKRMRDLPCSLSLSLSLSLSFASL